MVSNILEWRTQLSDCMRNIIRNGMNDKPGRPLREEKIVENLVGAIAAWGSSSSLLLPHGIKFFVESDFIHGEKSFVKFCNQDNIKKEKEAGDILLLLTVACGNELLGQRVSFVQVKKQQPKSPRGWKSSSKIDKDQLYFLSNFPEFTGNGKYFSTSKMRLVTRNNSLGTYIFFLGSGEITFLLAPLLERCLGANNRFSLLKPHSINSANHFSPHALYSRPSHFYILDLLIRKFLDPYYSTDYCSSIERFVGAWLGGSIGELWHKNRVGEDEKLLSSVVNRVVNNSQRLSGLKDIMATVDFGNDRAEASSEVGILSAVVQYPIEFRLNSLTENLIF